MALNLLFLPHYLKEYQIMYVLPDRKYQFPLESFVPVAVDDWVEKGRT